MWIQGPTAEWLRDFLLVLSQRATIKHSRVQDNRCSELRQRTTSASHHHRPGLWRSLGCTLYKKCGKQSVKRSRGKGCKMQPRGAEGSRCVTALTGCDWAAGTREEAGCYDAVIDPLLLGSDVAGPSRSGAVELAAIARGKDSLRRAGVKWGECWWAFRDVIAWQLLDPAVPRSRSTCASRQLD